MACFIALAYAALAMQFDAPTAPLLAAWAVFYMLSEKEADHERSSQSEPGRSNPERIGN